MEARRGVIPTCGAAGAASPPAPARLDGWQPAAASTSRWCGAGWLPAGSPPPSSSGRAASRSGVRRRRRRARLVAPDEPVEVVEGLPRFVSRAGDKLDGAHRPLRTRRRAASLPSTPAPPRAGSPTASCRRGRARVVAVDVGRGQLHPRLRADERGRRARADRCPGVDPDVAAVHLGGPARFLCADLSFISLRSVLDRLGRLVAAGSPLVLLVKPQFEAGRAEASQRSGRHLRSEQCGDGSSVRSWTRQAPPDWA